MMRLQMILRTGVLILGVAACGRASAQTAFDGGRAVQTPAPAAVAAAPTAAVRRRPRAVDVPATSENSANSPINRESPEDEALNRKINGICRGC